MSVSKMLAATRRLVSDAKGVTAVEYGVLGALIIVACIAVIRTLGTTLSGTFGSIQAGL